jgi:peptidoglycan/LPS O-acetylase OafA/YrhL
VTPRAGASEPGHVAALDGVRGLAILLVIWHHAGRSGTPAAFPALAMSEAAGLGWVGVDLFFVLSGMLITGILMDTRDSPGYFRSFYGRRTLRIFQLYYAALFIVLFVLPALPGPFRGEPFSPREGNWSLWLYLMNVVFALGNGREIVHGMLFPFWSLGVEEQFYLMWPLLVWVLPRRALGWASAALMVGALALRCGMTAAGVSPLATYTFTLGRVDALAAGALLAVAARQAGGLARWRPTAVRTGWACAAGLGAVVIATRNTSNMTGLMQTAGFSLVAVLFAAFLALLLTSGPSHPLTRFMELRWMRHIGARSYGLYVWHMVVIWPMLRTRLLPRMGVDLASPLYPLIVTAVALAASLVVSEASWRLVEQPFLKLKRYVPRPAARGVDAFPASPVSGLPGGSDGGRQLVQPR